VAGRYEARADCDPHPAYPDRARARGGHRLGNSMQQWARSVWLGQCAAAGNAHFRLAKVVEPRRYPARSLTRFARRRGPTRLLPALAPHRVPRNHCEEPVPLVLPNGHNTHPSVHGVRVSHSHEKQAPEPGKPAAKQAGCRPFRDGNSESPLRNQIFRTAGMFNRPRIRSRAHSASPMPP
jgi:hypothetical protein